MCYFINRLNQIVYNINKAIANISKQQGRYHDRLTHSFVIYYGDLYLVNKKE